VPNITAKTVAKLLFEEIICRHSAPRVLLSDRGTNFLSTIVKEVCSYFNITKQQTTAYHPQCDGMCERFNSTLYDRLAMFTNTKQSDRDDFLPATLFACRVSPATESTQHSPFFLMHEWEARLPVDTTLQPPQHVTNDMDEYLTNMITRVEHAREVARENIEVHQQKYKVHYDKRAKEPNYKVGDKVWVYQPKVNKGQSRKLAHLWHGPYLIIDKCNEVNVKLKRVEDNKRLSVPVHVNRLKLVYNMLIRPVDEPTDIDTDTEIPEAQRAVYITCLRTLRLPNTALMLF
jgi:hypothetical protein